MEQFYTMMYGRKYIKILNIPSIIFVLYSTMYSENVKSYGR